MRLFWTRAVSAGSLGLALAGLIGLGSCTTPSGENTSAVQAFISSLNGNQPLNSDVRITTGSADDVKDDKVNVTVRTQQKASGTAPSTLYTVVFTQATITYTRPDGFNKPGVDVPFPLTEAIAVTVPPNGTGAFTLTMVTHQAKLESPLRNLWYQSGELEISTTATIQLFGEDLAGNKVTAAGSMTVFFADFADNG